MSTSNDDESPSIINFAAKKKQKEGAPTETLQEEIDGLVNNGKEYFSELTNTGNLQGFVAVVVDKQGNSSTIIAGDFSIATVLGVLETAKLEVYQGVLDELY